VSRAGANATNLFKEVFGEEAIQVRGGGQKS
jgi:hypothetical protein